MDLKPGYKQTEIGVIPEDWDVNFVEGVALITTGSKNTQDNEQDGQYPFFVRSQKIERINSYSFDGEAVLTAGDGVGTGKVFHYIKGKFDVHQRVYRISSFAPSVNGYFFYLYFSSHFYNRIMQMTAKSSVDSVRREMIARMPILLPPLLEQQAIAEALSDADALIESLEQLIAKKRQVKQGTMQELLTGKTRLEGFGNRSRFNQSSIGTIPDDWNVLTILAISRKIHDYRGRTPKKLGMDWGDGDIPALSARNVKMGYIDFEEECNLGSETLYKRWMVSGDTVMSDIIFTTEAPLGNVAQIPDSRKYILSQRTVLFQLYQEQANNNFVYQVMRSEWFQKQLFENATGSTAQGIQRKKLETLEIAIPPLLEQQAIAAVLSDMDAEITALETKLEKARQVKQGMMHNLLTGRIRLV